MKIARRLLVLSTLTVAILSAQTNVSGTIASDSTWTLAGSPYIVTGNLTLNSGYTLTVDSGVVVRFQTNTILYVRGTMNARHALFTSAKDTVGGTPAKGDWQYIQVGDASFTGSLTLDTTVVRWGGYTSSGSYSMVYVYRGTATLEGCDISSSKNYGVAVYATGTATIINSNIFQCDWPLGYFSYGTFVFDGANTFTGNTHDGANLPYSTQNGDMVLDTLAVPYTFLQGYTVSAGYSLQVSPGNVLKFGNANSLTINGSLQAQAGVGEQIYFTAYTNDNLGGDTNADGSTTQPAATRTRRTRSRCISDSATRRCGR